MPRPMTDLAEVCQPERYVSPIREQNIARGRPTRRDEAYGYPYREVSRPVDHPCSAG
jgi:hypothetical protein